MIARNCGGEYQGEDGPPVMVFGKGKNQIILKECPNSYITDWSKEMIELFHLCHTVSPSLGGPVIIPGPLPSAGGFFDQDNATMEAFAVIRDETMKFSIEKTKDTKKKR